MSCVLYEFQFNFKDRNRVLNKVKTFGVKLVVVHNTPITRVKNIIEDTVELCGGVVTDKVQP